MTIAVLLKIGFDGSKLVDVFGPLTTMNENEILQKLEKEKKIFEQKTHGNQCILSVQEMIESPTW